MIKFNCPNCAKAIRAKDTFSGKKGRCPKCGKGMLAPESEDFGTNLLRTSTESWFYRLKRAFVIQIGAILTFISERIKQWWAWYKKQWNLRSIQPRNIFQASVTPDRPVAQKKRLAVLGTILLVCGGLLLIYFLLIYDTTVPVYPDYYYPDYIPTRRVYNVGLMNQQLVGSISGGLIALAGAILISVTQIRKI